MLNAILEDQLENLSTHTNEKKNFSTELNTTKLNSKKAANGKASKKHGAQKTIKNPISKLKYIKDIGLIATTFNGTIKFFDAFNFYQIWKNDNKVRSEN